MSNDQPKNEYNATDPLHDVWAQQDMTAKIALPMDPAALADQTAQAHKNDQRRLLWVNVREVVPSLMIAAVYLALANESTYPRALMLAAVIPLFVAGFLVTSSLLHRRADQRWGQSVREQLDRRLAQLNHRVWMYQKSAWWYFLPLALSFGLVIYGLGGGWVQLALWLGGYLVFSVVLHHRARSRAHTRYEVEAERLQRLLNEFDRAT